MASDGRQDCPLVVNVYGMDGPFALPEEWEHIMDGEHEDELTPQGMAIPRTRREKYLAVERDPRNVLAGEIGFDSPTYPFLSRVSVQWSDADQV